MDTGALRSHLSGASLCSWLCPLPPHPSISFLQHLLGIPWCSKMWGVSKAL